MWRRVAIAFLAIQLLGELSVWILPRVTGPEGPGLWVASVILLLPGDLAATWIIEKALWTSGLSNAKLQLFKTLFEIPFNAAVWASAASLWIRHRRRARFSPGDKA